MRRGYREFGGEETHAGVAGVCFVDTTPWIVRYRDEISRYPHMETMLRDAGGSWSAWEEVEMAWLDTCLTESHAAWRVVVGHHPVASHATTHGSARELDRVREIVERLGAVAYFNGHDHNLQHVVPATAATTPGGTPPMATRFVTSGAGSRTRDDVPVVGAEGTPEELEFRAGDRAGVRGGVRESRVVSNRVPRRAGRPTLVRGRRRVTIPGRQRWRGGESYLSTRMTFASRCAYVGARGEER